MKVSHIFVTHIHADHFCGFDQLLRLFLGCDKTLSLFGPPGFADRVGHKLAAYSGNLVRDYASSLVSAAIEIHESGQISAAWFYSRAALECQDVPAQKITTLKSSCMDSCCGFVRRFSIT